MSTAWPVTPLPEGCVEVVLVPPVRRQQATGLAGQGQRKAQQGGVDLLRALEGFEVDGEVDEGVERADRAEVARFGSLDAQLFGLTVDAFAGGTLAVNGLVERTLAIQSDAHQATSFQVDLLDAAFRFAKLLVVTGLAGRGRIEQRTAIALRPVAVGMPELVGGVHAQADGTQRRAIRIALIDRMVMLVEGDSGHTTARRTRLVDIPGIIGGISRDVGGKGREH